VHHIYPCHDFFFQNITSNNERKTLQISENFERKLWQAIVGLPWLLEI
jgi:hypothetical protein